MESKRCFVGVDVSKADLKIGVIPGSKTWKVSNDGPGIQQLIDSLVSLSPSVIVTEATGGYETLVASFWPRHNCLLWLLTLAISDRLPKQLAYLPKLIGSIVLF